MSKPNSPEWLKDFPDRDSAGYPCKVIYPTKEQMDSISFMCTGKPFLAAEAGKVVAEMLRKSLNRTKVKKP